MKNDSRYGNYTQLLEKVDAMFADVLKRHSSSFACKVGCHGCCTSGLSVSNVEASYIRDWLKGNLETLDKIQSPANMLNNPDFCQLLDRRGACSIYEVRPLICRSHGLPISWKESSSGGEDSERRDVCPLNFTDIELTELDQGEVLSIDKVNILLSLINRAFDESRSDERIALKDITKLT